MSDNEASTRFPYQHLAVLGMDKVKKYVPPETPRTNAEPRKRSDSSRPTDDE